MNSTTRDPSPLRDDDGMGRGVPASAQAEPYDVYWVESARRAFLKRWHDDRGDAIDTATQVYGEPR